MPPHSPKRAWHLANVCEFNNEIPERLIMPGAVSAISPQIRQWNLNSIQAQLCMKCVKLLQQMPED